MLFALLSIYIGALLGAVFATVGLIFCGYGWGPLPHFYLRIVKLVQSFYPHIYPPSDSANTWPGLITRSRESTLEKHRNDSLSSFKFSLLPMSSLFEVCTDAVRAGLEAIVQDQISVAFDSSPPFYTTLLKWPGRLPFPDAPQPVFRHQVAVYLVALFFRYAILLPFRFTLIAISFIYSLSTVTIGCFGVFSDERKIRYNLVYARIFCAGIGLIARYHNKEHRPKQPGIAVANHLSPNDIQILYADVNPSSSYGYTITGQRHGGILWALQRIVERACPSIWLQRTDNNDRRRFMNIILQEGRVRGPILLFPEGYCTNNTRVLQFRRAVFEENLTIYPIAIKQYARFGDSFWSETYFWRYLLRVLTSWAIVYEVTYLEAQKKRLNETNQQFAERVQKAIATCAGSETVDFDGRLWYVKSEQKRMKMVQMENIAKRLKKLYVAENEQLQYTCSPTNNNLNGFSKLPSSTSTILKHAIEANSKLF